MDEKKYKLICVRKGKTNYARTNNRKNVTLGSYIQIEGLLGEQLILSILWLQLTSLKMINKYIEYN